MKVRIQLNLHGIITVESASVSVNLRCKFCCSMLQSTFMNLLSFFQLLEDQANGPTSNDNAHSLSGKIDSVSLVIKILNMHFNFEFF